MGGAAHQGTVGESALEHALRKLLGPRQPKIRSTQSLIERFLYPKFGPGQMWEEVADQVREQGGADPLDHQVVDVRVDDGRVAAVTAWDATTGREIGVACDYAFSTMPVQRSGARA